jgi:hypothetical protein
MKNLILILLFLPLVGYSQAIVLEKPGSGKIMYRNAYTNDFAYFQDLYVHQLNGWNINENESDDAQGYIQGYRAFYQIRSGMNLFTVLGMYNVPKFKNMLIYVKTCTVAQGLVD